ncbi:MAG: hypothetical protein R3C05_13575 [Pirellulaceae bacterium]
MSDDSQTGLTHAIAFRRYTTAPIPKGSQIVAAGGVAAFYLL